MEEASLVPLKGTFMFVKFASKWGKASYAPPAPPPSIIDDGDGMAHIAPGLILDKDSLDKGLMRLIADVFRMHR